MGKQSRAKRDRRSGRGKTRKLVPLSRIELAAAENDRQVAAIRRNFDPAVLERVRAVVALMRQETYGEAQSKALSRAELSLQPPRNEEDVRAVIVEVLEGEPFNADLRDVLLKVRVDQRSKRLSVSAGPGLAAARAAMEAAALELVKPKLSDPAQAAG